MSQGRHHHHHHHHGRVAVGRIVVLAGSLLILVANVLVFRVVAAPPPDIYLEVITIISLLWMFAGALGLCARKGWGRYLMLAILYFGSVGLFILAIVILMTDDRVLIERAKSIFIAMAVYLFTSLVLTRSKDVRRLTSRAFE